MRGKGSKQIQAIEKQRITPAYAGKRGETATVNVGFEDHPRLCGEKRFAPAFSSLVRGSPPPMRGKEQEV